MLSARGPSVRSGLLFLAATFAPAPLFGHAIVLESSVAHDEQLDRAPEEIILRFNGRIEHTLTRATLERRDRTGPIPLESTSAGPDRIKIHLPPLGKGSYILRYRVLAADGHITEGTLRFHIGTGPAAP